MVTAATAKAKRRPGELTVAEAALHANVGCWCIRKWCRTIPGLARKVPRPGPWPLRLIDRDRLDYVIHHPHPKSRRRPPPMLTASVVAVTDETN